MPLTLLRRHLDHHRVRYIITSHSPSFTAQETAHAAHIHGDNFAKSVLVKIDNEAVMLVMPATCRVDLNALARELGTHNVRLASEEEIERMFPDCEMGGMPPFGHLYGIKTFLCNAFDTSKQIAFNSGSHFETMHMRFSDYILSAKVQWLQHGFHKFGNTAAAPTLRAKSRSDGLEVPTLH
jgi:Ala-tRNA(Pro) deacylase